MPSSQALKKGPDLGPGLDRWNKKDKNEEIKEDICIGFPDFTITMKAAQSHDTNRVTS